MIKKTITMADEAYIMVPRDWTVVNEDEAIKCKYAHALQINNASGNFSDFGTYVIFSNKPFLNNDDLEPFYDEELKRNPQFARVTRPSDEPKPEFRVVNGVVINVSDEIMTKLGFIGAFRIEDAGERPIEKVPYGVVVYHKDSKGGHPYEH